MIQQTLVFHGATIIDSLDNKRLGKQFERVLKVMERGEWLTLGDLEEITGYPQASISSRLRDARKFPHNRTVERRRRGNGALGLHEYRLVPKEEAMNEAMKKVSAETCRCVSCCDCDGSGNYYVDMRGRYIGQHRGDDMDEMETCDTCGGSGLSEVCSRCQLLEEMDNEP